MGTGRVGERNGGKLGQLKLNNNKKDIKKMNIPSTFTPVALKSVCTLELTGTTRKSAGVAALPETLSSWSPGSSV